ncbi:MAG TPA: hypothetical protein VLH15_00360, partial [Dehalococcoidales bacterium]|nr:hypothetical protein [Dehalococcoidales bacterium]
TFHGFSINQCVSTGNYMALTMIGSSSIFRGYLDFRSIDPVLTRTLETSERVIDITFGNTNLTGGQFTPDSTFTKNGDHRSIIINADYKRAGHSWLSSQIYGQAINFVDIYPPLINRETGYDLLGFIPGGKAVKQIPNVGKDWAKYYAMTNGVFGFSDCIISGTSLYGDPWDGVISAIATGLSLSPIWLLGAGLQLGWDMYKAGNKFYNDVEKRGGVYQFKS